LKRKFKFSLTLWPHDSNFHEVLRGTKTAFTTKIIGSILAFSFNLALGRLLGADGAGIYFLAFSITAIGSVIGRVGLDNVLLRSIAIHAASDEWGKVRAVHVLCLRLTVVLSGVIALIGFFTADLIASNIFNNLQLADPLRWMSLSILPVSILNLHAQSLKGLKRIRDATMVQSVGVPLISLLLIWPLSQMFDLEGVSWAYLSATSLVALLAFWAWHKSNVYASEEAEIYPFSGVWESSKPMFIVSLSNILETWLPLIFLGIWVSASEVGIFGAAMRLSLLISVLLLTLSNVIAPKYAELYNQSDFLAMGQIARRSTAMMLLFVSPLFLLMLIFSEEIMSLYGPDFASGKTILMILLLGQLVNLTSGSVSTFMMMSGHERILRDIVLASVVLQLALILAFAPNFGSVGVAIALASTMAIKNLVTVYMVYRKLGIVTIPYLQSIWAKLR
jgi:O-antigen/teichoic acid export membrane protein